MTNDIVVGNLTIPFKGRYRTYEDDKDVKLSDLSPEARNLLKTALRYQGIYETGDNHGEGCDDCLSWSAMKFAESVKVKP